MLKVAVVNKETTIEMEGPLVDILNDSLCAIGHIFCEIEKIGGVTAGAMLVTGIPEAIKVYREMRKEADKEAEHEKTDDLAFDSLHVWGIMYSSICTCA